jgi:tRNA pseudouridine38/39 synthase
MNNYATWSKEQLILKLISLEKQSIPKPQKPFHFSTTKARKIALQLSYLGHDYFGFTGLPTDSIPTIEREVCQALIKARLIPTVEECGWSRCGRTDKGVSGFGNVVSFWVRSNVDGIEWNRIPEFEKQQFDNPYHQRIDSTTTTDTTTTDTTTTKDTPQQNHTDSNTTTTPSSQWTSIQGEIPYISILNRLLPAEIRVLGWTPVPTTFDARFSCTHRSYKYFFVANGLDITAMSQAASYFVGTHDCRHICKLDPSKITNPNFFTRTVFESKIEAVTDDIYCFSIRARAFLWHQVRYSMALLFLVGKKREKAEVVRDMLDVSRHPVDGGRPQYDMAPDGPLVLMECGYEGVTWYRDEDGKQVSRTRDWIHAKIDDMKLKIVQLQLLEEQCCGPAGAGGLMESVVEGGGREYVPVMRRKRCDGVEEMVRKQALKKQKTIN